MEEKKLTNYNNFHMWFPDRGYRSGKLFKLKETHKRLIKDLDEIIDRTSFELDRFNLLRDKQTQGAIRVADLTKKEIRGGGLNKTEQQELDTLLQDKTSEPELVDLLEKPFNEMKKKGYSWEDLCK